MLTTRATHATTRAAYAKRFTLAAPTTVAAHATSPKGFPGDALSPPVRAHQHHCHTCYSAVSHIPLNKTSPEDQATWLPTLKPGFKTWPTYCLDTHCTAAATTATVLATTTTKIGQTNAYAVPATLVAAIPLLLHYLNLQKYFKHVQPAIRNNFLPASLPHHTSHRHRCHPC